MDSRDYERGVENSIREGKQNKIENDKLISNVALNISNLKKLSNTLSKQINSSNENTEIMNSSYSKSIKGMKNTVRDLMDALSSKSSWLCLTIVLIFVLLFLLFKTR